MVGNTETTGKDTEETLEYPFPNRTCISSHNLLKLKEEGVERVQEPEVVDNYKDIKQHV